MWYQEYKNEPVDYQKQAANLYELLFNDVLGKEGKPLEPSLSSLLDPLLKKLRIKKEHIHISEILPSEKFACANNEDRFISLMEAVLSLLYQIDEIISDELKQLTNEKIQQIYDVCDWNIKKLKLNKEIIEDDEIGKIIQLSIERGV